MFTQIIAPVEGNMYMFTFLKILFFFFFLFKTIVTHEVVSTHSTSL